MPRYASSSNTHLSSICVTDQTPEVETAMKNPDVSLSFPDKKNDFGPKIPKLYWREYSSFNAKKHLRVRNNIKQGILTLVY